MKDLSSFLELLSKDYPGQILHVTREVYDRIDLASFIPEPKERR